MNIKDALLTDEDTIAGNEIESLDRIISTKRLWWHRLWSKIIGLFYKTDIYGIDREDVDGNPIEYEVLYQSPKEEIE